MNAMQTDSLTSTYLLHEKLGEGGMGAVYRATHRLTGRQVALKRVHISGAAVPMGISEVKDVTPEHRFTTHLRLSLAREFETLASLYHPNIVNVLDYGFDAEAVPFFTMELLAAPQTLIEAGALLPLPQKVRLLGQLLQALAYLHRRNILHRDIKPSEVAVCLSRRR